MVWWWETILDAIPLVGTGYRAVNAIAAHISGDHERAKQQWAEAGANFVGDAFSLVTGGASKLAITAAKAGVKEGAKAIGKESLKQAAKQGGKAATRAARQQVTKQSMKKYSKKYVKKKTKKAIKDGLEEAAEDDEEEEDDKEEDEEEADNHERAKQEWAEAGVNSAGDALGLVTGGASKIAMTAAKAGVKEGVKVIGKESLKQAAKQGGKAATRDDDEDEEDDEDDEDDEEDEDDEDDKLCILEELHRFSGHWKGFYKQGGSKHNTQCMLIIDQDGDMAGQGSDEVSNYTVSGAIEPDGTFKFRKQYKGPTCHHLVVYTGSVEWLGQPVLQGNWTIPSDGQVDNFVIIADTIGLEASVISLCCYSAEEVLNMDRKQKREEVIEALLEIILDTSRSELASLSDEELINIAEAFTLDELYED